MRRLYLQIYLTFIGVVLLCVVVAGVVGNTLGSRRERIPELVSVSANMLDTTLRDASDAGRQQEADRWADRLDIDLGIWRVDGGLVVRTADHVTEPAAEAEPGWFRDSREHGMRLRLDDGSWFVGIPRHHDLGARIAKFVFALALLMLVMALGCYPIARRITRRLETLQVGVDQWGQGNLDTRVAVQGRDEVVGARVTAEPVSIEGNPRMLRRLLRNLFENARRHGRGAAIEARLTSDDHRALIIVADSGPGIPESERERVFEPFYRTAGHHEGEDGGVGLGLSLVRQIAEHHGGSVQYQANTGGGGRFEVELPRIAS